MGEEIELHRVVQEHSYFIPSHLTRALIASAVSFTFAAYAFREFKQVKFVEVKAMVHPP